MEIGVFLPIARNGYLISAASPQYGPTFSLNRDVVLAAERHGFDFALAMIKLRGYGGATRHWDECLEAFTLVSALAAVSRRIRFFPSVAVLTLPPALAARMVVTIDSVAPGRCGINIVSGWQQAEYDQMGLWPGDDHFRRRYEYCAEYAEVLQDLLGTGHSDFKGRFFRMDDCRLGPLPSAPVDIVCAGQSEAGIDFAARYGTYNFISGTGINEPERVAPSIARLRTACAASGRDCGALVLALVLAEETREAAFAKWERYKAGADLEALARRAAQAGADVRAGPDSNINRFKAEGAALPASMVTFIGSHADVAAGLDTLADIPGVRGIMLVFDDYLAGIETFGQRVQPLMRSRAGLFDGPSAAQAGLGA
ncbi:MAG: pyrimidine utilization protein A [Pseudomonadota bacterium]